MTAYMFLPFTFLLLNFGYISGQREDPCIIGITADNWYEAFIDGELVASTPEVDNQRLVTVPDNSNVLSIHAFNYQGASGILVMSNPRFNFYTTSDEDRLWWRCREVTGTGATSSLNPQLIPDEWKTEIDPSWPRAFGVGDWTVAFPWTESLTNRDNFIQDDRAEWIWTDDPGRNPAYDGTKNVFCSVRLPLECGGKNTSATSSCPTDATSVVIGNVEYCVKYVEPPEGQGYTWTQARSRALADNAILLETTHELLQEAATRQMQLRQAENAWIGGIAAYPPGTPWRFEECCGQNPLLITNNPGGNQDPYALFQQGCYDDRNSSPDLTGQPVTNSQMTVTMCVTQICPQSKYAGLKNGNTCTCSETFGRYGVLPRDECNMACAGGGTDCGGVNANFVYAVNGVNSIEWLGADQPNNYHGVDYCGAIAFSRQDGQVAQGKLVDERCRTNYTALCEVPASTGCPSGFSSSLCHTVVDGENTRYFVVMGMQESNKKSWYQSQQACRELAEDANLAGLFTLTVAESVELWLRNVAGTISGTAVVKIWVGTSRQSWFWESGSPVPYTNWARDEPATKDNDDEVHEWECMYMSRDFGYQWKAGRCNDPDSDNVYGYIQVTVLDKATAIPPTETTTGEDPSPGAAGSTNNSSSSGLSTFEIVLIVVLVVIVLILIILLIAFCCYKKKYGGNFVGPSKYDARPIAPIPTAGYLGEDESVYTVSETGSTADLLANPAMFGYGTPAPKSARSGGHTDRSKHRINLND